MQSIISKYKALRWRLSSGPQRVMLNALCVLMAEQDGWLSQNRGIHKGERCFLLGAGPSLTKVDLSRLKGERVMALNGSVFSDGIQADYFLTVSTFFYKAHVERIKGLKCRRMMPSFLKEALDSDSPTTWFNSISTDDLGQVTDQVPWGFSHNPNHFLVLGGTGMFVCLQMLLYLGFEEVILLGVDHDFGDAGVEAKKNKGWVSGETSHKHFMPGYYRDSDKIHLDVDAIEHAFEVANREYLKCGKSILNASPGSKLEVYPMVDFENLF
jgi:hypothetical protein